MSLSVLTLVKNRVAHLDHLVEGLRRSDTAPRELIVVDMSDTPVATPCADFPVRLIRLETDGLPLAMARNRAARAATGGHLLFLDVDCMPARGLAGAMADILQATDALVCADVRYLPAGAAANGWSEEALARIGVAHPVRSFPAAGSRTEPNPGLFWSLAFGIRHAAFERLGGFDEAFVGYGAEDTDFGFRARQAGLPLIFLGGPGAFHQHHGVTDPPLQHFEDILANARTFHARWGVWPMQGWLDAFQARGLIDRTPNALVRRRAPTLLEIAAARRPDDRPF